MPRPTLSYSQSATNSVNRYKHQAHYDLPTIHALINSTPVLSVSFSPPNSPFPVILPMIGQMGSFSRPSADIDEPLDLYLHGYVSSRIMNLTKAKSATSATESDAGTDAAHAGKGQEGEGKGLPVCISATKLDGLVLTLTPNSHNYNYRSALVFGYATPVTDVEEKLWAMELVTNSVVPHRWNNTRVPPNNAEMQSTQILRVKIESGSSKIRYGTTLDENADKVDTEITSRVWTGVVPVYETLGEPIPGPYNEVQEVPEHIASFVASTNESNRAYALDAAIKDPVMPRKKEGEREE